MQSDNPFIQHFKHSIKCSFDETDVSKLIKNSRSFIQSECKDALPFNQSVKKECLTKFKQEK